MQPRVKLLLLFKNVQETITDPPHFDIVAIPSNSGILYKMTSAATLTVTTPPGATIAIPKSFGNYKEQAAGAQSYNKELEEHGDGHHSKAKVIFALLGKAPSTDGV